MKNILLVCGTGASSGFMAKNIRQAAKARNIEIGVKARSDSVVEDYIEDIDLLLVGPHLSYMLQDLEDKSTKSNTSLHAMCGFSCTAMLFLFVFSVFSYL